MLLKLQSISSCKVLHVSLRSILYEMHGHCLNKKLLLKQEVFAFLKQYHLGSPFFKSSQILSVAVAFLWSTAVTFLLV